ncbi:MAG: PilZ domain-containing protein [Armatimonadetes bacterium]|nr:PilZ domain-containing protein [Armatimonadota bacterium]
MNTNAFKLSPLELDAFQEIANISACNATSCLSQLLDEKIEVQLPGTVLIPAADVPGMVGDPEEVVFAAYMEVLGGAPGFFLIVLPQKDVLIFLGHLSRERTEEERNLRPLEKQLMKQVATILAASYFFALGRIIGTRVVPEDPILFWDMRAALSNEMRTLSNETAEQSFFMRTEILVGNAKTRAYLFFLPYPETFEVLVDLVKAVKSQGKMKEERRIVPRVLALDLPVRFEVPGGAQVSTRGICGNISSGGMLLIADAGMKTGLSLTIRIESPEDGLFVVHRGKIVWREGMDASPNRMKYGVAFEDLTEREKKDLEEFVSTRIVYASYADQGGPEQQIQPEDHQEK